MTAPLKGVVSFAYDLTAVHLTVVHLTAVRLAPEHQTQVNLTAFNMMATDTNLQAKWTFKFLAMN